MYVCNVCGYEISTLGQFNFVARSLCLVTLLSASNKLQLFKVNHCKLFCIPGTRAICTCIYHVTVFVKIDTTNHNQSVDL